MILGTLIAFCLISLLNCEDIPKLNKFENFHSRIALRRKDAGVKTVTFIEEYWDSKEGRGRLDITRNNIITNIIYDIKTKQVSEIIGYNCVTSTLPDTEIIGWDNNLSDEAVVDVDKQSPLIIGPTAAWRKAIRAANSGETTYSAKNDVRGMNAKSWTYTDNSNSLTYVFFFAADGWSTAAKEAPLRIMVYGRYKDKDIDFTYDYYVFEKFDKTFYKFMPIIGVGCKGNQNTAGKILPKVPWNDFSAELEIMETSDALNFGQMRVSIYVDLKYNVSRTDITFLMSSESVIHDLRRGIIYSKKPNGDCFINPPASIGLDIVDTAQKSKSIAQMILLDRNYYYLGSTFERGVLTDVWESVSFNETIDEINMNKVVVTYFITANKDEIPESSGNQLPVKFIRTGYILDSQGQYQLSMKQEFNVFNFQKLYFGKNFQDVFNIENCILNEDDKKYFVFASLLKDHLEIMDKRYAPRYVNVIKKRMTEILASNYGISPLRVPFIDFSYQEKSIRTEVLVLERPPLLSSFEKKEDRKLNSEDRAIGVNTLNECAEVTIKRESTTGFKYCKKQCFVMTYNITEESETTEANACEFYALREINVPGTVLVEEPTTQQLKDKLFVTKLSIDVTDWKNRTTVIPMDKFVVSDPSTSLLSREVLYSRSVADKCLLLSNTSLAISAETLGDCYTLCKNHKDLQCQTFSFCSNGGDKKCRLSSVLISDDTDSQLLASFTESKEQCNVYAMNFLKKYTVVGGQRGLLKGFVALQQFQYPFECARACSTEGPCLSFQFCDSGLCALSRNAFQDFSDDDRKLVTANETCSVYEAKEVNLFVFTGVNLVAQKIEDTRLDVGVEECAKLCYEMHQQTDRSCLSFNYCPTTASGVHSSCQLSSASVLHGADTITNSLCKNFDRNVPNKNKTDTQQQSSVPTNTMTSKSFMGLIFGMFFVGLIIGTVGFFGYRAYQRRRDDNDGFGVSVRFIRHQDE